MPYSFNSLHVTAMVMTVITAFCGALTGLALILWGWTSPIFFIAVGLNLMAVHLLTGVSLVQVFTPEGGLLAMNALGCALVMVLTYGVLSPLLPTLGMVLCAAITFGGLYRVLKREPPRPKEPLL